MKNVLRFFSALIILSYGADCLAAPYVVTSKFESNSVTKCVFVLNGSSGVSVTPIVTVEDPTKSYCKYDVASSSNGNNTVSVTYTNMWGSSSSVPFSYVKTLPPTPSDIMLQE